MALTPAQRRRVNQLVTAALLPGRQDVARRRREAQRRAAKQQTGIVELSKALAELQRDIGPKTGAAYQDAAKTQGALAGGFSGGLKDYYAQEAADAAEILSRQGAPQGQIEAIAEVGKSTPDVTYALGGAIPGGALAREGAAFQSAAERLPATTLGRGQQEWGQIAKALREKEDELDQELADLMGKAPGLRLEAESQLEEQMLKGRAQTLYESQFGLDVEEAGERARHNRATEAAAAYRNKNAQRQYDLAVQRHELAVRKANEQGRNASVGLSKAKGFLVDQRGRPIKDANGKRIPVPKEGSAAGGLSFSERRAVSESARELLGEPIESDAPLGGRYLAPNGVGKKGPDGTWTTNDPKKAKRDTQYTFTAAIDYLTSTYGISRTQARKFLVRAGWKPPKPPTPRPKANRGTKNDRPG